ncbi:MAG: SLBB domain-containing protein [Candidatus Gorgyraea atricola]|nr:SLBB domain-containing protein [Candidatus Gorgyraea atricola]
MIRRLLSINLIFACIFLVSVILPVQAFSYETSADGFQLERVDESLGYKPAAYKKIRCPRCGMEFYYIEGKEGPHSHWVHYEISEEKGSDIEMSEQNKNGEGKQKGIFDLSEQKKELDRLKASLSRAEQRNESLALTQLDRLKGPQYELRQKLTCPYDGHNFFPEGTVIENRKLMQKSLFAEKPSSIEESFAKSIPFGVSKDLKQFGYDLFLIPEERDEKEESAAREETGQALGALGILSAAFSTKSSSPALSLQSTSKAAVVPIGPDYVVGPGDTLVINIWGSVQESFPVEVDREGKIMLPKAGPLYVWGLKIKETEDRIKKMLKQHYTNFYMDLSMGKLRDIQVYVMGEVKKPGSYTISSQSSIFQALYAAGGPTKLGSLRKAKLIKADGQTEKIDLYPFLLEGKMVRPTRVQSGDTIFIPTVGDVVAIAGNIKRPAIYETRGETPLQELLNFAGGVTPTGDLQRIQVERIENNERRVMLDIELKRTDVGKFSLEDISLQNGDVVIISPIVRLKHNFVSIVGNVERPGDYALTNDMSVSDIIDRAKGFLPGTYLDRAEIARVTDDRTRQIIPIDLNSILLDEEDLELFLDEWDILLVYSESQVRPPLFVEIDGAVNRPGKYELTPDMKVSDLIFKAGGVKPDEVIRGAELFHIIPGEQPVVRDIAIRRVSDVSVSLDKDIILHAGDALSVKSEPKLTERRVITIKGEVRYPGAYSARKGERLSSLIERSGGFTEEAFLNGSIFTRESIKKAQEKMRRRFIERENRSLLEEQQSILLRRTDRSNPSAVAESLKTRREMLEFISSADIEGRMVIKLKPLDQLKDTKYDILLEDGDSLTVPQIPSAIAVIGSVNNPTSVPFEASKGLEYYVRKTGGLTKHADKVGIYVIKANGEAVSKFMMSKRITRGDSIVVPQEFKYWTPPGQLLRDTVEILSRVAVGVGIIAALN